jgi:L-alanine-DL-glutamate epimerase-like enolase superfamily enzyme
MADPKIVKIELHEYEYTLENMGRDYNGFNLVYEPGGKAQGRGKILRIFTDAGIIGEYAGGSNVEYSTLPGFVHYLLGRSVFERELIYHDVRRALRQAARIGIAPIDIALWDIAGKVYNTPIYKLLGGYKESVPCYASTYHGDHQPGGLSTPEAFADFAEQCLEMGYPAFKIHGWGRAPIAQEIANVHAVGKRVGGKMDLMLDPACEYITFGDAVKVGWACDENRYFWYEDPYRDGGISQFAHRKLRQLIRTPLLQTEHVRSLEPHIDFVIADATDYVRGDVGYDGITGVMKLAHACEALGLDIEFHGPGPAQRQCMAAVRNTNYYEMGLLHPKAQASHPAHLYGDGYRDELDAIDSKGHVSIPQGPGLGVPINWDWVNRNRTGLVEYK